VSFKRGGQDGVIRLHQADATHDHDIEATEFPLVMTETFTHDSLEPITRHSRPGHLAGNGQAQTGIRQFIGTGKHGEVAVVGLDGLGKNAGINAPASQPGTAWQACVTA
jgi:hypothetical protein